MLSQGAIEQSVLVLLCHNEQHAHLVALKVTDTNLFSNDTHRLIAKTAIEYIEQHAQPPKGALDLILEHEFRKGESGKLLASTLAELQKQAGQVDPAFVLEQLDTFLESQRLYISLSNALEQLQEGNVEQAKETIYTAASMPSTGSLGIWMHDPEQAFGFLQKDEHGEFFSTGIKFLDERHIRLDRKTLTMMIAPTGKGKTWWLINVGKAGIQHHKRILHITLELDEEKTAERYIQSIFALTKRAAQELRIASFLRDTQGGASIEFAPLIRDTIRNPAIEAGIRQRMGNLYPCFDKRSLLIKQFPTGALSVEQLSLYLDSLERHEHFRPDLLIVDYLDLMRLDAKNLRIDTGRLTRDLRGLSIVKDFALGTATQGNRESDTAKLVGRDNVAEDWSKVGTADNVFTYSQTPEEKRLGLARIFVPKSRDEQDGLLCLIAQSYDIGQFAMDSISMNTDLSNQLQNL